jgi:predicted nucleic acid-binding protein
VIHLDMSFLIRALVPGSPEDRALRRWMAAGEGVAMSTIAWAELLCGPLEDRHRVLATRIVAERVPFVAEGSEIAARLYNDTGRRRGSLADCMIAATALRSSARLATTNLDDFRPFRPLGLSLIEP